MTPKIMIRPEQKSDYEAIKNVNDLAFNRPEEGCLVENLRQLPEFDPRLSLVAEMKGKIIGHALFLPIHIQGEDGEEYPCLSLGPIAVIPEYQKQGIGGQLIEAGHSAALKLKSHISGFTGPSWLLPSLWIPSSETMELNQSLGVHR